MSFVDRPPLWIRRERYSGETAELIDRCLIACSDRRGVKILIRAMCWLLVPLERRTPYWDAKVRLAFHPPQESSVPEEGFDA